MPNEGRGNRLRNRRDNAANKSHNMREPFHRYPRFSVSLDVAYVYKVTREKFINNFNFLDHFSRKFLLVKR